VAPSARRALLNRVTEILREELPFVPLYRQDDLYAIREGLVFEPTLGHRIPGATLAWSEGG
jgi:hypothetical protein